MLMDKEHNEKTEDVVGAFTKQTHLNSNDHLAKRVEIIDIVRTLRVQ